MRNLHQIQYSDLVYAFLRIYLPTAGQLARSTFRAREHRFFKRAARAQYSSSPARFLESSTKGESALDRRLRREFFAEIVPRYLTYEDRVSMASSVESRVPFLDHRLVEYAFGLNDSDKIKEGMTKYVMREAMRNHLPPSVVEDHLKVYIESPFASWLGGSLRPLVESSLLSGQPRVEHFLDPKHFRPLVLKVLEGHRVRAWELYLVWRALTAEAWLRRFFP